MKWSINTVMQILAILLQGLNQIIHAIPDSWRFPIAVTEPYTPKGAT